MTLQDIINQLGNYPRYTILYMVIVPALAIIFGMFLNEKVYQSPVKYGYSILIYATCIPGMFALTLLLYNILFTRVNILNLSIFAYYIPLLSLLLTLSIINKNVDLKMIPGFKKLSGFLMIIFATFILMLVIEKTRIFVVFFGSFKTLLALFVILFVVIKIGWEKIYG